MSAYWKHNDWPECIVDMPVYDGIICRAPLSIERVVFHGMDSNLVRNKLNVWQYDDVNTAGMDETALEQYLLEDNASQIDWIKKTRPASHWTAPYVTNHRYYLRWVWGVDFESVDVQV